MSGLRQRGEAGIKRMVRWPSLSRWLVGLGSRWTQGAGVVKALNPFCKLAGRHRSFVEVHLAKSRLDRPDLRSVPIPHIFTTSYLTHGPDR